MEETKIPENKRFSIVKRAESFTYAGRGIWVFVKCTHNAWIHLSLLACAVFLGFVFQVTQSEWISLIIVFGFVLVSEAFNTAIEIDIDLTSPNYHPYAKDTKDVAAGAVLISAATAFVVGLIIFLPHIIALFK